MGVSMWVLLFTSRFMAWGFVLIGGAGRAKGLGGPCAPAERSAPALGDGGGSTTPCPGVCCLSPPLPAVSREALASVRADAVPPSPSDCSLGICTFSRGRLASGWLVLERERPIDGVLPAREAGCGDLGGARDEEACGCPGEPFGFASAVCRCRCIVATSTEAARGVGCSVFGSNRSASAPLVDPQCCASIDRLSSIGVNMLCDFACPESGLGWGMGGLMNCCCAG